MIINLQCRIQREKRRRSLQQQELLTLSEYVSLSVVFSGVHVAVCLVFRVAFYLPLSFFLFFFLTLPVLQFPVSDYPFVKFKLVNNCRFITVCVPFQRLFLLSIKSIIIKDINKPYRDIVIMMYGLSQ